MASYYGMCALLLLLVAKSGSQDLPRATTDSEQTTWTSETWRSSPDSPLAKHLEAEARSSRAGPDVNSVPVTTTEALTSHEPTTGSPNDKAPSPANVRDSEERNVSLAPTQTSRVDDPSTTPKAGVATIPSRGEVDGPESPPVDRATTTGPSNTPAVIDGGDEIPSVTDGRGPRGGGSFTEGSSDPKNPDQGGKKDEKDKHIAQVIVIGVIIFVLIVLLVIVVFFMLRKKKRSGSFRTHSRKNAGRDVWAGQVPELGEGKAGRDPGLAENGAAGAGPEEQEMVTFVSGEKKVDSVVEENEAGPEEKAEANGAEQMGRKASVEEKTPLLEEASEESPESDDLDFPVPPLEQELMPEGH